MQHTQINRASQVITLIAVLAVIAIPRYASLSEYVTIDEHTWLTRSANFAMALHDGAYTETFQSEHPGVTLMWIGAIAQRIVYPDYVLQHSDRVSREAYEVDLRDQFDSPLPLLIASRALVVAMITVCLATSFILVRKLGGKRLAVLGLLLMALDPFTLGHTQLLHLDGLLSSLILVSYLALLLYLATRHFSLLLLSGVTAGLAFLTKSTALLALPGIVLTLLTDQVLHQRYAAHHKLQGWTQQGIVLMLWAGIAIAAVFALWPALWFTPLETLTRVLNGAVDYAKAGHEAPLFYSDQVVQNGQIGLTFYPVAYLWRSTPVALIGLLLAISALTTGWPVPLTENRKGLLGYLLLLSGSFLVVLSLGNKKFDRYMLPSLLPLLLVSSLGWESLTNLSQRRLPHHLRHSAQFGLAVLIGLHGFAALRVYPYPLSYYSPLLGGHQRAAQQFSVGWGDGLSEAAAYLNRKPHAEETSVASWYVPCFSYYYAGQAYGVPNATDISPEHLEILLDKDYIVTYINQWQRQIPKSLIDQLAGWCHEHSVFINGVEYVRIYSRQNCDRLRDSKAYASVKPTGTN